MGMLFGTLNLMCPLSESLLKDGVSRVYANGVNVRAPIVSSIFEFV